jgi:hypothetical protein
LWIDRHMRRIRTRFFQDGVLFVQQLQTNAIATEPALLLCRSELGGY